MAPNHLETAAGKLFWVIQLEIFRASGIDNLPEFSKHSKKAPGGPELGLLNAPRGYRIDCFSQLKCIHLQFQWNTISHGKSRLIHGKGQVFGNVIENLRVTLFPRPEQQSQSDIWDFSGTSQVEVHQKLWKCCIENSTASSVGYHELCEQYRIYLPKRKSHNDLCHMSQSWVIVSIISITNFHIILSSVCSHLF